MFEACTNLDDADTIEGGDFERSISLGALLWIETALAIMIIATAYHVTVARKEKSMRATTAQLDDLLLEHIECLHAQWHICLINFTISELSVVVATPSINLSLRDLVSADNIWAANCGREISTTRDLLNLVTFE